MVLDDKLKEALVEGGIELTEENLNEAEKMREFITQQLKTQPKIMANKYRKKLKLQQDKVKTRKKNKEAKKSRRKNR